MSTAMSCRMGVVASRLATASKKVMNQGAGRVNCSSAAGKGAATAPQYAQVPKRLLEKMKLFQAPNDLPVHIKGGYVDKLLFYTTALICTVGLIECFHVYYVLSFPRK